MNWNKIIFRIFRDYYRYINKALLFILSVFLIVIFTPKEIKFKYEYHKGKPWLHNDLIAPFDFSIHKTQAEYEQEKLSILNDFIPYFTMDERIYVEALSAFNLQFEKEWEGSKAHLSEERKQTYYQIGKQIVTSIFQKGIVNGQEFEKFTSFKHINLLRENKSSLVSVNNIYTIQSANDALNLLLNKETMIDKDFLRPIIQNVLAFNIFYNEDLSEKQREILIKGISPVYGLVQTGEKIISKGEVITQEKFQIIESLKVEYQELTGTSQRYYLVIVGHILIVSLLILVVFLFIYNFRRPIFDNNKKLFFIILQMLSMVVITKFIVKYDLALLYVIPVCITPIIVRAFFDTRLAIFIHVITVIIISSFAPNSYEFVLYHLIAGIVAVLSIAQMTKRSQLFFTSFYIFLTYVVFYVGFLLIFEGSLQHIDNHLIIQFLLSAILNLLAFPLIFFYERLFGYATDFSLLEISNTNNGLLRELATKAPGTFQHSIQVANMSEEAIFAIGGNPLLVRAGALYHDIGKILTPYYFIENQVKNTNPHQDLSFCESAKIIIKHVIQGVEIAKKNKLPEYIIDFIRTHHGTKRTDFFYKMQLKEEDNQIINEADFTYRGPLPFSKETAILMMADAIEAASRSLIEYNDKSIDTLVDAIIDTQINEKQFVKSDITFKDVTIVRKIFKKILKNIYHIRIAYPT